MKFLSKRFAATWFFAGTLLTGAALLSACAGDNAFVVGPGTGTGPGGTGSGAQRDTVRPTLNFVRPVAASVAAVGDSLRVEVAVSDAGGLARVEISAVSAAGVQRYERATRQYPAGDTVRNDTVRVLLAPTGERVATDPLLVIARVSDRAGNVREDTVRVSLALIRGRVIALPNAGDRIADIQTDGRRVFFSNYSRNRVEVLPIGGVTLTGFRVGSQPWGLAVSPDRNTLYVANSGGTNISVVNLAAGELRENEAARIQTPNVQLFEVPFSRDSVDVIDPGTGARRKVSAVVPSSVTEFDYSDRPQFIAQTQGGQLLYSTRPTGTAPDGTIRRRRTDGSIEFFVDYARRNVARTLVIVNARDAGLIEGDPNQLGVLTDEGEFLQGFVDLVEEQLRNRGSRTRFEYFLNVREIGLRDTTFVAVSGDHRQVAFGEGATDPGRIMLFTEGPDSLLARIGNTRDLVGNTAERIIGLALNRDGTLGAARGREAYFFNRDLRLQGVGLTGEPTGGISLHPEHAGYPGTPAATRLAFVSGVDDNGSPYVDVVDTFSFFRVQRIFVRERITGSVLAVLPPAGSSAVLMLYAVTARGVLELNLTAADLRP
ncbi:MAG: hypothetical protein H0V06_03775 [Gemmatimonadetes bacterium]|nr:hypothetical protein [Gemmatimonadota bacterium]